MRNKYEDELINKRRSKHAQSSSKHRKRPTGTRTTTEGRMIRNERITSNRKGKKIMTDRKKRAIKRFNTLFIIAYLVFAVYRITAYFSWRSLALPMMKNECSTVVDMNGNVVDVIGGERVRENVPLSEMPQDLKNAYVDIEDERFYKHGGVDLKRTTSAIGSYVLHGGKSSYGGSTITQQLVKNITSNDDTSIGRKVGEWTKAVELESFASKDEILESYLNIIYTAPNVYGVSMGSRYYFNKDVRDLKLSECAFLAGINVSPNSYNPFGESDNSERIKKRTKTVLKKMLDLKHISQEQYDIAVKEVDEGLEFSKGDVYNDNDGVYSYYTDATISEVISDLSKKKHISKDFATNYIYMAGVTIYSNEDASIQEALESEYNQKKYIKTSSSGQTSQSAMVIMDHSNGKVRAVVGGLGEKTTPRGFNRATQAVRQTGSSIKPIAVLAPGLDKKIFTGATMYADEPTTFKDGNGTYSPKDNDKYIGDITVRRAVESSQNIPFVKMMEQVTPETSVKYLEKMGITTLTDKDKTLSLALGGQEKGITPLEMAGAYATIANDGVYIEPTFYSKVVSKDGKNVIKSKQKKKKVFSKEVAYVLKELLKQPVNGSNGTARPCKMEGMDVAAKTGTTNDNYDKWLCGFTTYYTAVTWYGYDTCETISYSGKSPAVLLWSAVMKNVHSDLPNTTFQRPASVKQAEICQETGKIASSRCSNTYTEYFLSGTLPTENCVACTGSGNRQTSTQRNNNNYVSTEEDDDDEDNTPSVQVTNVPQQTTQTTGNNNSNNKDTTSTNSINQNTNNSTNSSSTSNTNSSSQSNNTNTQNNQNNSNTNQSLNSGNGQTGNNTTSTTADDDEQDDGP